MKLGETVEEGQPIGTVRDYFGEVLDEQHAPATGIVLFSVTSMAINAGEPLLAIGTD